MTYTTNYETRDGKTRRVKDAPSGAAKPASAPDTNAAAEPTHAPAKPAKQGA
jgi:hypothetical protein